MSIIDLWTPLFDSMRDCICLMDKNHKVLKCNAATRALLNKTDEEICGQTCWKLFHNCDSMHVNCPVVRWKKEGKNKPSELQIDEKWFEINCDPILDDQGELSHILHSVKFIDERKKVEAEAQKSSERFRAMIDKAPYGALLYHLADDGKLIFSGSNASADKILGVNSDSMIGKTIEEVFPNLVQTEIPEAYKNVARTGKPYNRENLDYEDDRGISGSFEIIAFQTEKNKMAALFRDVSEKKRQTEALQQSQAQVYKERQRLEVTLRSIGDGVITTDDQGKIVFLNTVAEQMTGWTSAEAFGKPLAEVFHIINEFTRKPCENPVEKVIKTGLIVELANHTMLISRDGREIVLADSGAPIKDEKGNIFGVVLVFRDETQKQRMLDTMQQAQKLDSLGILAGGLAHDFNNLLGGIFGYIDLALTDNHLSPKTSQYLQGATKALSRAKSLTQQLLTFAKGGVPVRKSGSMERTARESSLFALSGSAVSCRFTSQQNLWNCEYDENQISQVIDNIVRNAQQSMPMGGSVDVSVSNCLIDSDAHAVLQRGEYLKICIKDYGIGMPKEIISKIFDPFFTTKHTGRGLGLSTSYSIIHKHDGYIEVESEPGKGTMFSIYLPATHRQQEEPEQIDYKPARGSGRILIMDDEEFMRTTYAAMLERLGYEVTCVVDGTEALAAFASSRENGKGFAAIILDLTIPGGIGGKEVAAQIRKIDHGLPIIVASGYSDDPVMAKPANFGFTRSLAKPFSLNELSRTMHELLQSSSAKP